jgi:cytochrome b subunit of formate dehydrogenase
MSSLFQLASDRAGYPYWARLSPEWFWACLWLVVLFCAIHVLRRSRSSVPGKTPARYNFNQRLYHWGNFLLLGLVAFSGYWLFFRRAPGGLLGLTWLQIHSWGGLLFAAGVIVHSFAAILRGDWRSMRPEMQDLRDAGLIWRNFLGRTSEYPAPHKYDALQKLYHHVLAVLAITFTTSGVWMWLSAERFHLAERSWLHSLRIIHDLSAVALVVLVIGHIYFSIIKANRANLKDMAGVGTAESQREAAD